MACQHPAENLSPVVKGGLFLERNQLITGFDLSLDDHSILFRQAENDLTDFP
jgi:hypothetical protein